jgi:hypothetical protein
MRKAAIALTALCLALFTGCVRQSAESPKGTPGHSADGSSLAEIVATDEPAAKITEVAEPGSAIDGETPTAGNDEASADNDTMTDNIIDPTSVEAILGRASRAYPMIPGDEEWISPDRIVSNDFIDNPFDFPVLSEMTADFSSLGSVLSDSGVVEAADDEPHYFDYSRTVELTGLTVYLNSNSPDGAAAAPVYRITGDPFRLSNGIMVGSAVEQVVELMGGPDLYVDNDLTYVSRRHDLSIGVQDGVVSRILWAAQLD